MFAVAVFNSFYMSVNFQYYYDLQFGISLILSNLCIGHFLYMGSQIIDIHPPSLMQTSQAFLS